jgi:hypothetical protein
MYETQTLRNTKSNNNTGRRKHALWWFIMLSIILICFVIYYSYMDEIYLLLLMTDSEINNVDSIAKNNNVVTNDNQPELSNTVVTSSSSRKPTRPLLPTLSSLQEIKTNQPTFSPTITVTSLSPTNSNSSSPTIISAAANKAIPPKKPKRQPTKQQPNPIPTKAPQTRPSWNRYFTTPTLEPWSWNFSQSSNLFPEETTQNYDICGSCCVGMANQVTATGMCMPNMTDATFNVGRDLFPLADTFQLIHHHEETLKKNILKTKQQRIPRFTIIGDSLGGQLYSSACCELARTHGVTTIKRTMQNLIGSSLRIGRWGWRNQVEIEHHSLFTIRYNNNTSKFNAYVSYIRQYRPYDVGLVSHLCKHSDIILFAWGVHYRTYEKEDLEQNTGILAGALVNCTNTTLIWAGANAQHFEIINPESGQREDECGEFGSTESYMTCGPLRHIENDDEECYSWRSRRVFEVFRKSGKIDTRKIQWLKSQQVCNTRYDIGLDGKVKTPLLLLGNSLPLEKKNINNNKVIVWFLPWWELTAPFAYNHAAAVGFADCTHLCYTPAISSSVWDGIYLAQREQLLNRQQTDVKKNNTKLITSITSRTIASSTNTMISTIKTCEALGKPLFITGPQSLTEKTQPSKRFKLFEGNIIEERPFDSTALLWEVRNGVGIFVGDGLEYLEATDAPQPPPSSSTSPSKPKSLSSPPPSPTK